MSHEVYEVVKIVAAIIGVITVVGGGGVALGKWLFGKGNKEGSRETAIDAALARLNKVAEQWEKHLSDAQQQAIANAYKEGERIAWQRAIEARVTEMDGTLEEMMRQRYSMVRGTGGNHR